jgi:squalene-hopene/tetraprenyl-beta-curcumene cyclase
MRPLPSHDRRASRVAALLASALLVSSGLAACGKDEGGGGGAGDDSPNPPPKPVAESADGAGPGPAGGYGYASTLGADVDRKAGDAIVKGRRWLLSQRDEATGTWGDGNVGFTALAATAVAGTTEREAVKDDPVVGKALDFLRSKQAEDGSISGNPAFVNYETSAAVLALATAKVAAHAQAQVKARDFLASSQIAGDETSASYGGFPYQSRSDPTRPTDLSNLQFAATALHDADLPKDHEAWKRMRVYLDRVQNRSESNTFRTTTKEGETVVAGDDGGGYYAPGVSMAGLAKRADGTLEPKSYGSMTYALLKCLLFAGVPPTDPRVTAAVSWLERHYTVDRNPGREDAADPEKAGREGYYYYLLTMARAAAEYERATGKPWRPRDASGTEREWRKDVASKLASLQQGDGSWVNEGADRWEEGNPVLVTAYALQTLALAQGRLP